MIYILKCGNCLSDNYVESDDAAISWVCSSCDNENSSTLSSNPNGTLVTDDTKSDALLSTAEASKATDIVDSEPLENSK